MALHIAAQKNLIDIYKMLIEFGADPKSMDQKGRTANYYIRWQRESQSQNSGFIPQSTSSEFHQKFAQTQSPAPIQVIHTILPKETGPYDRTKAKDKIEKTKDSKAKDSKVRESIALRESKVSRELKASKVKPELKSLNEPIKTKLPSVFGDSNMNSVTSNYNINSESIRNVMETTDTDTGTDTSTETGTVIDTSTNGSMTHGKTLITNEQNIVKSNIPSRLPSISPPISSSSFSIDGMMNESNENGNGNEIGQIKFTDLNTDPNTDSNINSDESDKNSSPQSEESRKIHDESELESIINNDDDVGNVNVKENEKVTKSEPSELSEPSESERETNINNEITNDNIKEMKKVNKQHENDQKQNYKYEKINETSDVTHEIKLNSNEMDGLSNSNSDLQEKQNKQGNDANLGELHVDGSELHVDGNEIANGKMKKSDENGKHKNNTKKNKLKMK